MVRVLILEPFYGGSHKQLIDYLSAVIFCGKDDKDFDLFTLPAKKWHWRARTSALHFAEKVPENKHYEVLFLSSVLNLAELLGLRPDLSKITRKIVYFHENQLAYPVRETKDRDFQYGYNQITTCLAADEVIFNSNFNKVSFLENLGKHFNLQPDFRPNKDILRQKIERKSTVIYFPVSLKPDKLIGIESEILTANITDNNKGDILRIVWPHRWEHDKNPEDFFQVLFDLRNLGCRFQVSVLGESFSDVPDIFNRARSLLSSPVPSSSSPPSGSDGNVTVIRHWGYLPTKSDYWRVLGESHVVVSTANHEFFGVSTLEAVSAGCFPLVPNRLVYPEIYPKECLYNTNQQL